MTDALRDQTRDKLRAMMYVLKKLPQSIDFNLESKNFFDRLTFLLSMKNVSCRMMPMRLISLA